MIRFKNITFEDKDLILSYTIGGSRQNCDLSFSNLISWRFAYNTQFAIIENCLVFRFIYDNTFVYMAPVVKPNAICNQNNENQGLSACFIEAVKTIMKHEEALSNTFKMLGVCSYMKQIIERNFPNKFIFEPDTNRFDYIYEREKIINLQGKKLQSKRNHINKFKKLYEYEYKELTLDLIPQCLELQEKWNTNQDNENDTEYDKSSIEQELRSITKVFSLWDKLNVYGGCIFVDNKLIAFSYGCPINEATFDVCVEKADIAYEGSFAIMNQEMAKHIPEQYIYINREEDLGDEGLRKAKLSYKPDILLEKNVVTLKEPTLGYDEEFVKNEVKKLWKETFNDSDEFINLYFSKVYKHQYNVSYIENNIVKAALQALPYSFLWNKTMHNIAYISGVNVSESERKNGIGTHIMRQTHINIHARGCVFACLIPAEEWLFKWYSQLGYSQSIVCKPCFVNALNTEYNVFYKEQSQKSCTIIHSEAQYNIAKEDIILAGKNYIAPQNNVQGMIRIINVEQALMCFAQKYPEIYEEIKVFGDDDIQQNNMYFKINNGKVYCSNKPNKHAKNIHITQLSEYIFRNEDAEMCLMMN